MGTHMKDFHFAPDSRSVFSRIGVVPARQNDTELVRRVSEDLTPASVQQSTAIGLVPQNFLHACTLSNEQVILSRSIVALLAMHSGLLWS